MSVQYGIVKSLISAFFTCTHTQEHFSHCYRHSLFGTNAEFVMLPYVLTYKVWVTVSKDGNREESNRNYNAVSIETTSGVLCVFPLCMYNFSTVKAESAIHAHDAVLWGRKTLQSDASKEQLLKIIIISVIIFIIIPLIKLRLSV